MTIRLNDCILIANQLALHRRVLVYCAEGKQRSVTIICAWLISSGMSLQDTQQKLIVKHKLSFDSSDYVYFYKALKTWENRVIYYAVLNNELNI